MFYILAVLKDSFLSIAYNVDKFISMYVFYGMLSTALNVKRVFIISPQSKNVRFFRTDDVALLPGMVTWLLERQR